MVLIREICPEQIMDFHLSQWRGYSFAIDISIFLNKYIKSSGPVLWMNTFFNFFISLKKHGIKAVCIFDGPFPPIEKKLEQESRVAQSQKAKDRLAMAIKLRKNIVNSYIPTDIPLPEDLQEKCKKVLLSGYGDDVNTQEDYDKISNSKNNKKLLNVDYQDASDVYEALKELINRLEIQTMPITNEQREKAWEITRMMGLPTFQADGEAEALCAYLCIHGYVDAVLSEDTDVLAYGTPFFVAYKDYKLSDEKVKVIHLPSLLATLDYTIEEFRDLCILLSCDYNSRIKGFPPDGKKHKKAVCIGWKGAFAMINEYRTLENCEEYIEDITPLKYERCRELFTPINNDEMQKLIETYPYSEKPKLQIIKEFIAREGLYDITEKIEKCWEPAELIFIESSEEDIVNDSSEEM